MPDRKRDTRRLPVESAEPEVSRVFELEDGNPTEQPRAVTDDEARVGKLTSRRDDDVAATESIDDDFRSVKVSSSHCSKRRSNDIINRSEL